jgi:hypothetical protein
VVGVDDFIADVENVDAVHGVEGPSPEGAGNYY